MAGMIQMLVLVAAASCADAGAAALSSQGGLGMSPVTRVVELLKGMSGRIEADGKAEEDLYENFVCWATSIVSQKEKSNAAAQSRADTLQTYISDLSSGRIELTSERVDLEKEIETLNGEIEAANQMREREARDFNQAKDEMNAAIDALTKAIDVLRTATEGHEEGVLMSLKGMLGEGSEARAREAATLAQAVELGKRVLTKGDALFLQRLLTGQVPERASWKKLNRKATFKNNYKARSFQIQSVLAKLLETFALNLKDATAKEAEAVDVFNKLAGAKGNEKNVAEDNLSKMDKENGAKQLSLGEANEERESLLTQINDDTGYIAQVRSSLAEKKSEWQARKVLRTGELAAIAKAVEILHNDDARDLFKKSFASQGLFFLQEGASRRTGGAVQALRSAAWKAHDSRLSALAAMAAAGHFDEVLEAIDSMVGVLRSEEQSDLDNKEACESDRATDSREAIKTSRAMDELTESIVALQAHVADLASEIEDKEAQVAAINVELNETADEREKEHQGYLVAKQDDQDAAALIVRAKDTLEEFYRENELMLVQGAHSGAAPFTSTAGEAPPPPPATWKGGYGGKTEETTGVVAILGMIHDDVLKDMQKADDEEGAAVALYGKTKENLETERSGLTSSINDLILQKSGAEGDIQDKLQDRSTKTGELGAVMKKMSGAAPGCDFVTINFQVRSQNRKVEIDGLEKAKAILSGGVFDGLPDPNREIQPGDAAALTQTQRRKFLRRQA